MKPLYTILLLVASNAFMTFAWYGHLKLSSSIKGFGNLPLILIILMSWAVAFFEYCCQVPANRIGYSANGGPFSLIELKIMQEVISLTVFTLLTLVFFKTESFHWNHIVSFIFLILAVYFSYKKF